MNGSGAEADRYEGGGREARGKSGRQGDRKAGREATNLMQLTYLQQKTYHAHARKQQFRLYSVLERFVGMHLHAH